MTDKSCVMLRGHHLPSLRTHVKDGVRRFNDESMGYTAAFAEAFDAVYAKIAKNPDMPVRIIDNLDSICSACPRIKPDCSAPGLSNSDRVCAASLGLSVNAEYPAKAVVKAVMRDIFPRADVKLKNGETMNMKLVSPPVGEYAEKIIRFLEHAPDHTRRFIRQVLRGDYEDCCVNNFYVGELDGKIAGLYWCGYSRARTGVASFHVYTHPGYRDKGLNETMIAMFRGGFSWLYGCAAFYDCDSGQIAKICFENSFQPVIPGADKGPLALMKKKYDRDTGGAVYMGSFGEFEKNYYQPSGKISVNLGSMGDRYDIDTLLRSSNILHKKTGTAGGAGMAPRVGLAALVPDYMRAIFMVEDGKGVVTVARTGDGKVVGWGFFLSCGADEMEKESKVFDYELHPAYEKLLGTFIGDSLRLARENGIRTAYSYCPAAFAEKAAALVEGGFREIARLPGYCRIGGAASDLLILRNGKHEIIVKG